jgi:hypothetical protein
MAKNLFPKNFLTIQVPPTIRVKERRDGALVIEPPTRGDRSSTMSTAETVAGTVSTSSTETYQGTSTEGETHTRTLKSAMVLKSGKKVFPVIAAGFSSVQHSSRASKPDLSRDSFQVTKPIPQSNPGSAADVRLTAEPRVTDFRVKNVIVPSPDEAKPTYTFPDVSPPWDGGVAIQFDPDDDHPGDTDNDPDSDDDDDSDDGKDEGTNSDTMDFPGGLRGLQKHIKVNPSVGPQRDKRQGAPPIDRCHERVKLVPAAARGAGLRLVLKQHGRRA